MIKIPAAILNSLDKNNSILPTAEAVAPKIIKIIENPSENKIVFKRTFFLSFSISFKFFPVIKEMYPGIIGNTQGVKKLINPAPNAKANLTIIQTLYLPLISTAITLLTHDNKIHWFSIHSFMVFHIY